MNKNKIMFAVVFLSGILAGVILLGGLYSQRELIFKVKSKVEAWRVARIPKKTKQLVINDFESPKEIDTWKKKNAEIFSVPEHAASGRYSARVDFQPSPEASGIVLSEPFRRRKDLRNWDGYEAAAIDIYNPSEKEAGVKIKIRDGRDRTYTETISLNPKTGSTIFLSISELRGRLDPSRIEQMNIFFWNLGQPATLYMDYLRLVPGNAFQEGQSVILQPQYLPEAGERIYKKEYYDFGLRRGRWLTNDRVRVPLYVNNPSAGARENFPVSGGVPFPKGELKSAEGLQILSHDAAPLPAQYRILGHWPDGSIKWLQVDTVFSLSPFQRRLGYLEYAAPPAPSVHPTGGLTVEETKDTVVVRAGEMKFSIRKGSFKLWDSLWLDRNRDGRFTQEELMSTGSDLILVHRKEEYRSSLDPHYTLTIEEKGPLKTTIKAEGWFTSKKRKQFCKFIVRLQAFANENFVRVYHTFIYTGYPENKHHYLYQWKHLPKNETIEGIYIETPIALRGNLSYALAEEENHPLVKPLDGDLRILQDSSETFVVHTGGYESHSGKKLEGWLDISAPEAGISVVVKNFWQQFPKGWRFDAKKRLLKTQLWPESADALDLKTTASAFGDEAVARGSAFGLGKTHEMLFYFHPDGFKPQTVENVLSLSGRTLLLSASPEWVGDTVAVGKIKAFDPRLKPEEEAAELIFDWARRQVEMNRWYGMLDFGDTISSYNDGWVRDGRHGWFNNEAMGVHSGSLLQYLRTGQYKYFQFAEALARHIMDVDTIHYNTVANDKRLRRVIPDDYSQVGSQHRHNADHWGGRSEETSHTNLHGILLYYYMTGYERALDVAKEIGEFFLKERMTYFRHPDICPQRNIANVLWGAVEMYEATADPRYKKLADKWADVLYKGQRHDGTWTEDYNPLTRRWEKKESVLFTLSFTLPALVSYHQWTGNKAVAEAIIKATQYYMHHKPYNPFFEAISYSYHLTGDPSYLEAARERMGSYMRSQRHNNNPLEHGMIYQKASYARVMEFLYQFPYAFQILEEKGR